MEKHKINNCFALSRSIVERTNMITADFWALYHGANIPKSEIKRLVGWVKTYIEEIEKELKDDETDF
jgi:predicted DNA-binding transcriptional regulator